MSAIQTLKQLIYQLNQPEISLCRQYLEAFDRRGKAFTSKSIKLFDLLASAQMKNRPERELEFLIYGKRNTPAFSRLQLRLRDKLLDALGSGPNILRSGNFTGRTQKRLQIRNKLNHADILLSKNQFEIAETICYAAIQVANQYELFDEKLAAHRLLEQTLLARNNQKAALIQNGAILKCRQTISVIETAIQLDLLEKLDKQGAIRERLKELHVYAQEAPSAISSYILLDIEIRLMQKVNETEVVQKLLKRQLRILNPFAFEDYEELWAKVKLQLASNFVYRKRYMEAIRYASEAEAIFKEGHREHVRVLETLGIAYFQSKRFSQAKTLLDQETFSRHSDELGYLKATVCFVLGKYEEAEAFLADFGVSRLTDKKHGAWPFLVLQMIRIEWGIKKDTSRPLKQAQKNLKVFRLHEKATPRENIAWTVLLKLAFAEFDFKMLHQHSGEELEKLRTGRQEYAIPAGSPELIPFDQWFMAMVMKISLKRMLETS